MPESLSDLLRDGCAQLVHALGEDGTRINEATILLGSLTGYDRARMVLHGDDLADPDVAKNFDLLIQRRMGGEPVYRILGEREFHGLRFKLSAETLEPRDDTEALIELVLDQVGDRNASLRFADLGTGTGAIAVSLLSELPNAHVLATDLSTEALETALTNAQLNGVGDRFATGVGSWCGPLAGELDFIVSNPPYIATTVVDGLAPEVLNNDPRLALDGGLDGLDAYREIFATAAKHLDHKGFLALEIGFDQALSVGTLAQELGWKHKRTAQDLGRRDRAVLFSKA